MCIFKNKVRISVCICYYALIQSSFHHPLTTQNVDQLHEYSPRPRVLSAVGNSNMNVGRRDHIYTEKMKESRALFLYLSTNSKRWNIQHNTNHIHPYNQSNRYAYAYTTTTQRRIFSSNALSQIHLILRKCVCQTRFLSISFFVYKYICIKRCVLRRSFPFPLRCISNVFFLLHLFPYCSADQTCSAGSTSFMTDNMYACNIQRSLLSRLYYVRIS